MCALPHRKQSVRHEPCVVGKVKEPREASSKRAETLVPNERLALFSCIVLLWVIQNKFSELCNLRLDPGLSVVNQSIVFL